MAASLELGHETYSYPLAASLCFPPDLAAHNSAAMNFLPPASVADYFPELGDHAPDCYSQSPAVFAGGAVEDEMNMSYVDDGRTVSRAAAWNGRPSSRIGFRTWSAVDVLDDGFKWRKYGKKAVKSSPNPRNYYRCSVEGCGVKKRVERDRDDARYVVTTYDGVHNHAAPGCGAGHPSPSPPQTAPYTGATLTAARPGLAAPPDAWGMQLHASAMAYSSESSY